MTITAALVKELRERTGLGMMECKKALVESDGDIELAIENLRKSGQAKAAKKAGRTAAEGAVMTKTSPGYGIILEVNSETDFVARDDNFRSFIDQVSGRILALKQTDVEQLLASTITANDTVTIEEARQELVQKVGENIQLRRVASLEGELVGSYLHNQKIGVLVALQGGDSDLARDVAMHIAATNPMVTNPQEIPQAVLDKEKEIFSAQARESGKPEAVIEKMIDGRLKKFMAEVSLTEQSFVKDPDQTVGALLKQKNAAITGFVRFEVGEGIEKEEKDFAAEVMAQVNG